MNLSFLDPSDRRAVIEAFQGPMIRMRVSVTLRDSDEDEIGSLTADPDWEKALTHGQPGLIGGQVDADVTQDVDKQLSVVVLDPKGKLDLDRNHPGRGLFIDRFVQVTYDVWVGDWVKIPVFYGPVSRFERTGVEVTIEAMSKEALGLDPYLLWDTVHLRHGDYVVHGIRRLMEAQGERRFDLPDVKSVGRKVHPKHGLSFGRHSEPYKGAKKLANSVNRQLYYDDRGYLKLRRWPEEAALLVSDGYDGHPSVLVDPVTLTYDFDGFCNVVEVLGAKPEKGIERIRAVAMPKRSDPYSPWSMSRNGQPRYIVHVIENNLAPRSKTLHSGTQKKGDHKPYKEWKVAIHHSMVHRRAHADEIARHHLKEAMRATEQVSTNIIPHPFLELGDIIVFKTRELGRIESRLDTFTLPLTSDATMSIGFNKYISLRKKGIRVRDNRLGDTWTRADQRRAKHASDKTKASK